MLRTVADDTPSPAAVTSSDEATGSPDAMYSRTSAANTRFDLSVASGIIYGGQPFLLTAKSLYNTAMRHSVDQESGTTDEVGGGGAGFGDDLAAIDPGGREVVHEERTVDDR